MEKKLLKLPFKEKKMEETSGQAAEEEPSHRMDRHARDALCTEWTNQKLQIGWENYSKAIYVFLVI